MGCMACMYIYRVQAGGWWGKSPAEPTASHIHAVYRVDVHAVGKHIHVVHCRTCGVCLTAQCAHHNHLHASVDMPTSV